MHRCNFVPRFVHWVENFDCGESLSAVVAADGVQLSPHHGHAHPTAQHAHRQRLVPAASDRIERLYRAQRIT
jgi:hypothetical protein